MSTATQKPPVAAKPQAEKPATPAPTAPSRPVPKFREEPHIDETLWPRSGDRVFYFPQGDFGATPTPATVLMDSDTQRALYLEVHHMGNIQYVQASKHMHGTATQFDRQRNGGWSWNRSIKPLPKPELKS